jgi:hypothetical protein
MHRASLRVLEAAWQPQVTGRGCAMTMESMASFFAALTLHLGEFRRLVVIKVHSRVQLCSCVESGEGAATK